MRTHVRVYLGHMPQAASRARRQLGVHGEVACMWMRGVVKSHGTGSLAVPLAMHPRPMRWCRLLVNGRSQFTQFGMGIHGGI